MNAGRFRRGPALAAVVAAAVIAATGACTAHAPGTPAENAHMDRRLHALADAHPDSIVGVLIRTAAPPDSAWRAAMTKAGLDIGTVAGDIVTGRLRAGAAAKVAELPFVVHIELSRKVPIIQHPS